MKINHNKLIINLTIWAVSEITLNLIGLDTLADYSEFLSSKDRIVNVNSMTTLK